ALETELGHDGAVQLLGDGRGKALRDERRQAEITAREAHAVEQLEAAIDVVAAVNAALAGDERTHLLELDVFFVASRLRVSAPDPGHRLERGPAEHDRNEGHEADNRCDDRLEVVQNDPLSSKRPAPTPNDKRSLALGRRYVRSRMSNVAVAAP